MCILKYVKFVCCGCETRSLVLKVKRRRSVFEKRVVGTIFVSKGDEVRGDWSRLHNEKLYDLYSIPNIIWLMKSE